MREQQKLGLFLLQNVIASVQRANLILSELISGLDATHILNFSVNTNALRFERFVHEFVYCFKHSFGVGRRDLLPESSFLGAF